MLTDKEFLDLAIERGLKEFKSKRQLAFAIGLENAQSLNHWIKREKVPGDWKPAVAKLLNIEWLDKTSSPAGGYGSINMDAADYALVEIIRYSQKYPKTMEDSEWRKKAFKTLYKAWFIDELKDNPAPLLILIE